jgi:hypothetical protein
MSQSLTIQRRVALFGYIDHHRKIFSRLGQGSMKFSHNCVNRSYLKIIRPSEEFWISCIIVYQMLITLTTSQVHHYFLAFWL